MKSIELFSGAGGLALGISRAGFEHKAIIEWNKNACDTIRANKVFKTRHVTDWPLYQADVRDFDFSTISGNIDLLAGGPPCQPFSLAGKHRGFKDARNMFPEMIRVLSYLKPKVVLIENVKGLLRESFAKYFEYIILQLSYPDVKRKKDEEWFDHISRLEQYHTRGRHDSLHYKVVFCLLNSADYGVPQKRERVFIVGFRADLGIEWHFPKATHSYEALVKEQWLTGAYWEKHKISKKERSSLPVRLKSRIAKIKDKECGLPWTTVRDAIFDLPDPQKPSKSTNHVYMPGARIYHGHSGSPFDEPAKTLKAGDHGVPGGENMLVLPDGRVRYFTVRESARLQTFPDDFCFPGSWTEAMRQIGNAVPVELGHIIAEDIKKALSRNKNAST